MNSLFLFFAVVADSVYKLRSSIHEAIIKKKANFTLNAVNALKALFINLFLMILSLFFVFLGLILLPVSIIMFSPWDDHTRMWAGIIVSFAYLLTSVVMYLWMFERTRWNRNFMDK
ncbi:MAG TPA: hypothetical protein PLU24_01990 [Candidatus Omnitrophota bacterium]|nr:hypothetical protein [Candidatus Omnitrophota bacterium]